MQSLALLQESISDHQDYYADLSLDFSTYFPTFFVYPLFQTNKKILVA